MSSLCNRTWLTAPATSLGKLAFNDEETAPAPGNRINLGWARLAKDISRSKPLKLQFPRSVISHPASASQSSENAISISADLYGPENVNRQCLRRFRLMSL